MPMAARSTAESRRIASPALRTLMSRRTAELSALALGILGLALLVALASYDPRDPSLNTATDRHVSNLAGTVGAGLADILLQGFGVAGLLPGVALLAWAWRIGSHRGLGSMAGRLAAMLGALPMLAASLPHAVVWPTGAGPGGAIGFLLARAALGAGSSVLGPFGAVAAWMAGAALAIGLTLLALGLSPGEWRAAGRLAGLSARYSWAGGRGAAWLLWRGARHVGAASGPLSHFLRREPGMEAPALAPAPGTIVRREPTVAASRLAPAPDSAAEVASVRTAHTTRTPTPPPRKPLQGTLPLPDAGWQFPPLSLLKPAPARASSGPSEEACLVCRIRSGD